VACAADPINGDGADHHHDDDRHIPADGWSITSAGTHPSLAARRAPGQQAAIRARVRSIRTRGEVIQYIAEVRQKIRAAKPSR
jgi:hypothetical protein